MKSRNKPGVAFWATVVVVGIVAYFLSLPIALTLAEEPWMPEWVRDLTIFVYGPVLELQLKISGDTL